LIRLLQLFQKRLKYGLPTEATIILYELGFSDRVIAQELSDLIVGDSRTAVRRSLKEKQTNIEAVLERYPRYFTAEVFEKLV